jgi:hypothetical protein
MITALIVMIIILAISVAALIGWGVADSAAGWRDAHSDADPRWATELAAAVRLDQRFSLKSDALVGSAPVSTDTDAFIMGMRDRVTAAIERFSSPLEAAQH